MWVLHGRWKPAGPPGPAPPREATSAAQPLPWGSLPAHLPEEVVVWLGREDLFPFRIQYLRGEEGRESDNRGATGAAAADAIVTMELFEVTTGDLIDPRVFQFQPPTELEVKDRTDEYLAQLGVSPAA